MGVLGVTATRPGKNADGASSASRVRSVDSNTTDDGLSSADDDGFPSALSSNATDGCRNNDDGFSSADGRLLIVEAPAESSNALTTPLFVRTSSKASKARRRRGAIVARVCVWCAPRRCGWKQDQCSGSSAAWLKAPFIRTQCGRRRGRALGKSI